MSVRDHLNVTDDMTCLDLVQSLFFNGSFPQISAVGAHDKTCQPAKVCKRRTTVSPLRLPEFFLIHRETLDKSHLSLSVISVGRPAGRAGFWWQRKAC